MQTTDFYERNATFATGQQQNEFIPCRRVNDFEGTLTCCWRLTWRERLHVLFTGIVWQQMLTYNDAPQPQRLSIAKPNLA